MFNSKSNYKIFKQRQQQQIVTIEFPWQGREGSLIPCWNVRKCLSLIWRCVEGKVCKIHNVCMKWLNLNLLIVVSVLKDNFWQSTECYTWTPLAWVCNNCNLLLVGLPWLSLSCCMMYIKVMCKYDWRKTVEATPPQRKEFKSRGVISYWSKNKSFALYRSYPGSPCSLKRPGPSCSKLD